MLPRLGNALASSIGKKFVMALTGLMLIGFLLAHLLGNLSLYLDSDGAAFDAYAHKLKSTGALLYVAEVGLGLLFLAHMYLAFRTTMENREARKQKYVIRANKGAQTVGSSSMFITGSLVLAYLLKHLWDFRLDTRFNDGPADLVKEVLAQPLNAGIYALGAVVLTLHLSHGFRSAFQSVGISHPGLNTILEKLGLGLAVLLGLGFLSFPLYYFLFSNGGVQ